MSSDSIKVAVRARPLIQSEKDRKLGVQWSIQNNNIFQIEEGGQRIGEPYTFDHIFEINKSNAEVYNDVVKSFIEASMNGVNSTIFAYGQTSSGKTYTMLGDKKDAGIMTLSIKHIFESIDKCKNRKFLVRVSYIEIYNEKISDLLEPTATNLKLREFIPGMVTIQDVKEEVVSTKEQVFECLKIGNANRHIAETKINERSSRSHTILKFLIESTEISNENDNPIQVSSLNLVDLAGSERVAQTKATGARLKEGGHINKSLSTLSLVIRQLSDNQEFVNFRDSKLTRLLQHSLGGNAKTLIIATITLASIDITHSTLSFAQRAKAVKNKPQINEMLSESTMAKRYVHLNVQYKKKLEEQLHINQSLERDREESSKLISRLKEQIQMLETFQSGEMYTLSVPVVSKRRHTIAFLTGTPKLPVIKEEGAQGWDSQDLYTPFKTVPEDDSSHDFDDNLMLSVINDISAIGQDLDEDLLDNTIVEDDDQQEINLRDASTPKSDLRQRLDLLQKSYDELAEFTKDEQHIMKQNDVKIANLEAELSSVSKAHEDLKNLHDKEVSAHSKTKLNYATTVNNLNQKITTLSNQLSVIKDQRKDEEEFITTELKNKFLKREQELLSRIASLESTNKTNTGTRDISHIIDSDHLLEQLTLLKVYLENDADDYDKLVSEKENLKQRFEDVENKYNESKDKIKQLQDAVDCNNILLEDLPLLKEQVGNKALIIHDLENQLQHAHDDRKKHLDRISDLETELQSATDICQTHVIEMQNDKSKLQLHANKIQDLEDNCKKHLDMISDLETELQSANDICTRQAIKIEDLESRLRDLESASDSLNEQVLKIQELQKQLHHAHDDRKKHLDRISDLETELQSANDICTGQAIKIQDVESKLQDLEAASYFRNDQVVKIKELQKQLHHAHDDRKKHLDRISDLETELQSATDICQTHVIEMQNDKSKLQLHANKIQDLEDNCKKHLDLISDLETELQSANDICTRQNIKIEDLESRLRDLESASDSHNEQVLKIQELQKQLHHAHDDRKKHLERISELKTELQFATDICKRHVIEMQKDKSKLQLHANKIQDLEGNCKKHLDLISNLETELQSANDICTRQAIKIRDVESRLRELESASDSRNDQIVKIQELQKQLQSATDIAANKTVACTEIQEQMNALNGSIRHAFLQILDGFLKELKTVLLARISPDQRDYMKEARKKMKDIYIEIKTICQKLEANNSYTFDEIVTLLTMSFGVLIDYEQKEKNYFEGEIDKLVGYNDAYVTELSQKKECSGGITKNEASQLAEQNSVSVLDCVACRTYQSESELANQKLKQLTDEIAQHQSKTHRLEALLQGNRDGCRYCAILSADLDQLKTNLAKKEKAFVQMTKEYDILQNAHKSLKLPQIKNECTANALKKIHGDHQCAQCSVLQAKVDDLRKELRAELNNAVELRVQLYKEQSVKAPPSTLEVVELYKNQVKVLTKKLDKYQRTAAPETASTEIQCTIINAEEVITMANKYEMLKQVCRMRNDEIAALKASSNK